MEVIPIDFKLASQAACVAAGSPRSAGRLTPMTGPPFAGAAVVVVVVGGRVVVVAAGTAGFREALANCVPPAAPVCFWPVADPAPPCDCPAALWAALTASLLGPPPTEGDVVLDVPLGEDAALTG
jgi:hypothetical protein